VPLVALDKRSSKQVGDRWHRQIYITTFTRLQEVQSLTFNKGLTKSAIYSDISIDEYSTFWYSSDGISPASARGPNITMATRRHNSLYVYFFV